MQVLKGTSFCYHFSVYLLGLQEKKKKKKLSENQANLAPTVSALLLLGT